jgi:hypothetical protein
MASLSSPGGRGSGQPVRELAGAKLAEGDAIGLAEGHETCLAARGGEGYRLARGCRVCGSILS